MLKRLHLCLNHRCRVKRYRNLAFEPGLNLLIGPNGTGKSTIMKAIAECPDCQRVEDGEAEYVYFDTENMNPHMGVSPTQTLKVMALRTRAMFSSHGEILQAAFSTLRITPRTCLLLDEPEAGQDFAHVMALHASMQRAAARGAQVICATHEVLFWQQAHIIELRCGYRKRITDAYRRIQCTKPDHPVRNDP